MRGVPKAGKSLSDLPVRSLDEPQQILTVTVIPHGLG
jgi:hypothetical protein